MESAVAKKSDLPSAMSKITFQLEYLRYLRRGILITSSTPPARIISRIAGERDLVDAASRCGISVA